LLNRRAAAHYFSVSPQYIDSLRAQRLLSPVPMPSARGDGPLRTPRYDRLALDSLIEKLKAGGVS